jgi:putative transposase
VILLLVRWYLSYSLSYRDVEELALERGLKVDHLTIHRGVVEYSPQLEEAFRKRYKRSTGGSLRMDETYIKVKRQWMYLYRAVDKAGNTVDFILSEKRDEPAARAFFLKVIDSSGIPQSVTMDKSGANKSGIGTINLHLALLFMLGGLFLQIKVRQIKYLNNIVEQDRRFIKKITKPMKGFKAFHSAKATRAGIELHHMLRKKQHAQAENQPSLSSFMDLHITLPSVFMSLLWKIFRDKAHFWGFFHRTRNRQKSKKLPA